LVQIGIRQGGRKPDEEFSKVADSTGLKPGKLAELLGKTPQTLRLYRSGARNVPLLVAEKVKQLDRAINGGE